MIVDPASPAVRAVLTGVMLASLLMAAALPGAFGAHDALGTRLGTSTDATRGLLGDLRHLQQQQEGTS